MNILRKSLHLLLVNSLVFLTLTTATYSSTHGSLNLRSNPVSSTSFLDKRVEGRILRAAQSKSSIKSRSIDELFKHEHELHYLDGKHHDSPQRGSSQFAAKLSLTAARPTLLLEDFDHQLDEISCSESRIELGLVAEDELRIAYREFSRVGQFLLITSHESCNQDGERTAYLVSNVYVGPTGRTIILVVTRMPWQNALQSLTVDFGKCSSNYEVRRHPDLRKRQSVESSTSDASATSTTISFPVPPSSSPTPSVHEAHGDIGKQFLDQSILPPSLAGTDGITLHGPLIPQGLTVSCKNCTTQGTIDLLEGSFTLNTSDDTSNDVEDIALFFNSGYIELVVNDFLAHIELESTIQPSASLILYTAPLPEIGIPGFQIPGVGIVGPIFKPLITFGVRVDSSFDVTYGFDLTIPNNSTIIIDIANVTNSSISGFLDAKIAAIPFQASLDSVNLTLSTAFTPELLLGISVFGGHGEAGAGVFLDLPTVTATVSQVAHVDSDCNPATNSSSEGNNVVEDLFDSLTNIVPEINLDIGLVAEAQVQAGPYKALKNDKFTVASKQFTLPTACLSYDAQAKTFGAPTATPSGKKGGDIGAKSAATGGLTNPFAGVAKFNGKLQITIGMLAIMLACFIRL